MPQLRSRHVTTAPDLRHPSPYWRSVNGTCTIHQHYDGSTSPWLGPFYDSGPVRYAHFCRTLSRNIFYWRRRSGEMASSFVVPPFRLHFSSRSGNSTSLWYAFLLYSVRPAGSPFACLRQYCENRHNAKFQHVRFLTIVTYIYELPELYKCVTVFTTNDINSTCRYRQTTEKLSNVRGICRLR